MIVALKLNPFPTSKSIQKTQQKAQGSCNYTKWQLGKTSHREVLFHR